MESENKVRRDCERKNRGKTARSLRREGAIEIEIGRTSRKLREEENNSWRKLDKVEQWDMRDRQGEIRREREIERNSSRGIRKFWKKIEESVGERG